jgi:hypothetical protein
LLQVYDGGVAEDAAPAIDGGPCPTFTGQLYPLRTGDVSSLLVPLPSGDALLTTSTIAPRFFRVDQNGPHALTDTRVPADFSPSAAATLDGQLWYGGSDGTLAFGTYTSSGGLTLVRPSTASAGETLRWIDGSAASGRVEIYALGAPSGKNWLYRFDGQRFETLWSRTTTVPFTTDPMDSGQGGVWWVGPGEAYAIPRGALCSRPFCVLHVARGTVKEEATPPTYMGGPNPVTAVMLRPGLEPIAGTTLGRLLVRDPASGSWRHLADGTAYNGLYGTARVLIEDRSVVLAFSDTWVTPYTASFDMCPFSYLDRRYEQQGAALHTVVPLADGYYATTGDPEYDGDTPDGDVSILAPCPPEAPCR